MKEAHYGAVTPDVQEIMAKIYARDLIASNNRTFALSAVNDMDSEYQRRQYDDGTKTIPISFMSLMAIAFHVFAVISTYIIFEFGGEIGFILSIGTGIAWAFCIIFDIIMGWEYISDKYQVRFK